ncbi:hypothetical protein [Flavobacterium nitrogenifigens]|uniref:Uncharacterized protein n=1 Tax=Flavobacterium nitrogenifigens TaxID=1617283 RepID=A0A521EWR4_9FLAO|nr:hypothetical protein [Flavobacterium nitrogenifigens]KAF2333275.1 hypothetical protein DM397_09655 [Flavobacterium nitrogenifigens]SMO87560.1 hypothetical protein SAMN06265220_105121 [Flavobacterium nitrogenifigens]
MNLLELIKYFRSNGKYEAFCLSRSLNTNSEAIDIYMTKPFVLNKELAFFEIEDTEGKIEYTFNGLKYFNLFDFYFFLDAIEELNNDFSMNDNLLAQKLFNYAIQDA